MAQNNFDKMAISASGFRIAVKKVKGPLHFFYHWTNKKFFFPTYGKMITSNFFSKGRWFLEQAVGDDSSRIRQLTNYAPSVTDATNVLQWPVFTNLVIYKLVNTHPLKKLLLMVVINRTHWINRPYLTDFPAINSNGSG